MSEQTEKFEHWAIVEVFGHQTYAGKVTEQTIGGNSFVRIDIPETSNTKSFTKMFGQNAIYGITIVDEKAAKAKAAILRSKPIETWELGSMIEQAIKEKLINAKLIDIN